MGGGEAEEDKNKINLLLLTWITSQGLIPKHHFAKRSPSHQAYEWDGAKEVKRTGIFGKQ